MYSLSQKTCIPIDFREEEPDFLPEVAKMMAQTRAAQSEWARTPWKHRQALIRELRRLIAEGALQLAHASAASRTRPAAESLAAEVLPLVEACRFLEREGGTILAPHRLGKRGLPLWLAGVRSEIHREPLGLVLIIGPGNYPLLIPGVQALQALAGGNAVMLKPGVGGTPAASALRELVVRAGFDERLTTLLPESTEYARAAILTRPDKVLFTGAAATGAKILAQLAPNLIPATMELSGCDAVIIRADANLDLAVRALIFGLTLNSGATCIAPKRVFVDRSVAAELEARLAHALRSDTGSSDVVAKSIQNSATNKMSSLIEEALADGAQLIVGNTGKPGPLILGRVSPASELLQTDLFARVLSIVPVKNDDEAVSRASDCPFALGASVFSTDERAARSIASRLNAGVVTINDLITPAADARIPFGGRGHSGFGVTRGAEGLLELTTPKVVTITRGQFRPAFGPAHSSDQVMFQAYLALAHGRGFQQRWAGLLSLIRSIFHRQQSFTHSSI